MTKDSPKPRRLVTAHRVLALGASAALLGTSAAAAPMSPVWSAPQSPVHRVSGDGEGEGDQARIEAEGEGDATQVEGEGEGEGDEARVEAEGEGEGEGEASGAEAEGEGDAVVAAPPEGEAEGGGAGPEAGVIQSRELLEVDGLLRAAIALRDAGETEAADAMIEEAAEKAEHDLSAPLADTLYAAIKALKGTGAAPGFAPVQDEIAQELAAAAPRDHLTALPMALRAAAELYGAAISDGAVSDKGKYLEAYGLFGAVRADVEALAAGGEGAVAALAGEMLAQVDAAAPAFGGPDGTGIATPEASLLYGAAARIELAALKLR